MIAARVHGARELNTNDRGVDDTRMTAAIRQRLAAALGRALRLIAQIDHAESVAIRLDRGIGLSAFAAIKAMPRGPARAVEARRWIRRAEEQGLDRIATLFTPGMDDDDLDAMTELQLVIAEAA